MWIKASLIAVGFVAATAAAPPAPTLAQGVYVGPGGVSALPGFFISWVYCIRMDILCQP
jgi:hypothetical protein